MSEVNSKHRGRVAKEKVNGVVKPDAGTIGELVWEIVAELGGRFERVPTRKEVSEAICGPDGFAMADGRPIMKATVQSHFTRWCDYNGCTPTESPKGEKVAKASKRIEIVRKSDLDTEKMAKYTELLEKAKAERAEKAKLIREKLAALDAQKAQSASA